MPTVGPKRDLLAREYIKDFNGVQAAIRAGYAPTTAQSWVYGWLAEPETQEHIARLIAERNKKLEIDAQQVLRDIMEIALADPAAAYDEDGSFKRDIHQIPAPLRKTISSIKTTQNGVITEVKFWDKLKALEMLGRHLSLFTDVIKIEGADEIKERLLRARKRAINSD